MSAQGKMVLFGAVAGLLLLSRPATAGAASSSKRRRGLPPKSMMGPNAQPSIAGFHPAGATFSVWAESTETGTARAIKIAPIGEKQKWVRISGGPPYTAGYDSSDRLVTFHKAPEKAVLQYVKASIIEMLKVKSPLPPHEDQASGGGANPNVPLVVTMGNLTGVPPDVAVYEVNWDGPDPR